MVSLGEPNPQLLFAWIIYQKDPHLKRIEFRVLPDEHREELTENNSCYTLIDNPNSSYYIEISCWNPVIHPELVDISKEVSDSLIFD